MATGSRKTPRATKKNNKLATTKNIEMTDLNDDCFDSIFRLLSLDDLNSVNLLSHRLNDIVVNSTYRNHAKFKTINIARMIQCVSNEQNLRDHMKCLEQYFKRFGHLIESIVFDNSEIDLPSECIRDVFSFIGMFSAERLNSLKIHDIRFVDDFVVHLNKVFNQLTKLEITSRWTGQVLPTCSSLDTLIVNCKCNDSPLSLNYIGDKLKTFELHFVDFVYLPAVYEAVASESKLDQISSSLTNFLKFHTDLVSLTITVYDINRLPGGFQNLKCLQELTLKEYKHARDRLSIANLERLCSLPILRKLSVEATWARAVDYSQFLQKSNSVETLEHLEMRSCKINDLFIAGLSRFRNVRYLAIVVHSIEGNAELSDEVGRQLRELNSITELHLNLDRKDDITSMLMTNLVQNNLNLKQFSLEHTILTKEWFLSLANLEQLESLKFVGIKFSPDGWTRSRDSCSISITDLQSFNSLDKIKNLWISAPGFFEECIIVFLQELGSYLTLEELRIDLFTASDRIFNAIENYRNLQKIYFSSVYLMNEMHLEVIGNLPRIKHVSIDFRVVWGQRHEFLSMYDPVEFITNQSVINLVKSAPTLESIKWEESLCSLVGVEQMVKFDMDFYNNLVDIVRDRSENRKLSVNFTPNSITEFPKFAQRYVQIDYSRWDVKK